MLLILKEFGKPDLLRLLDTKHRNLREAELRQEAPAVVQSREAAYQELVLSKSIWDRPSRKINQLLHRLMGKHRFKVLHGKIVGMI